MNAIKQHINQVFFIVLSLIFMVGCDDNTTSLQLSGDTWLKSLKVDDYQGVIDNATKTVVIEVPVTCNTDAMKVTAIEVSDGAEASMKVGDVVNFSFPQTIKVTNGDAFFEYTVTVKHEEAKITSFKLNDNYTGVINEENHSIQVRVPTSVHVTSLIPTIETTEGATVTPASGVPADFTSPVEFTVTYKSATATYVVTVVQSDSPEVVYVGLASSVNELNPEEKEAATWMLQNIANSEYVSFADVLANRVDLSGCKVMWWHLHADETIDNLDKFKAHAVDAVSAIAKVKQFYENGGSLLLTRYATFYPALLGVTDESVFPNNCWLGRTESNPEIIGGAWSFVKQSGHEDHPIYANLISGTEANKVYTCDTGYGITNTTAQWVTQEKEAWSTYLNYEDWRSKTGAIDLAYGDPNTVVIWEFKPQDNKGGILCIGSGCYDWYSSQDASGDQYHGNVATLTKNAIEYLMGQSKN